MRIRAEREEDQSTIYAVNASAFETKTEADLVDNLRARASPIVSLVAEDQGAVVGHILFSPVTVIGDAAPESMGLAPMAVAPGRQRQGIGTALVRSGLERCRDLGIRAVFVLGHPDYYPRFGFAPSVRFGLRSEYEVPEEVFMALELEPGSLDSASGAVRYHAAFSEA